MTSLLWYELFSLMNLSFKALRMMQTSISLSFCSACRRSCLILVMSIWQAVVAERIGLGWLRANIEEGSTFGDGHLILGVGVFVEEWYLIGLHQVLDAYSEESLVLLQVFDLFSLFYLFDHHKQIFGEMEPFAIGLDEVELWRLGELLKVLVHHLYYHLHLSVLLL